MSDAEAINDTLFAILIADPVADVAVSNYIRDRMTKLYYIPNKYFLLPPTKEAQKKCDSDLRKLCTEISINGFIALGQDGEPLCLTDSPPEKVHDVHVSPGPDGDHPGVPLPRGPEDAAGRPVE